MEQDYLNCLLASRIVVRTDLESCAHQWDIYGRLGIAANLGDAPRKCPEVQRPLPLNGTKNPRFCTTVGTGVHFVSANDCKLDVDDVIRIDKTGWQRLRR